MSSWSIAFIAAEDGEEAAPDQKFKVILVSYPLENKINLIKAIRYFIPELGLQESKDLVESKLSILKDDISKEEAELLEEKLQEAGAVIKIEESL